MKNEFDVHRLQPADAYLATQAIRALKSGRQDVEAPALDTVAMSRWLSDPSHILIVAFKDRISIGFALGYFLDRIDGPRPMVCFYEIVVSPDCRKRGVGRRLVEQMKHVAHAGHAKKMWVQAAPDNIAARALYQSAGAIESDAPDHVYSWTEKTLNQSRIAKS